MSVSHVSSTELNFIIYIYIKKKARDRLLSADTAQACCRHRFKFPESAYGNWSNFVNREDKIVRRAGGFQ